MLFAGVRARALSGSTPDYPDDEHETLCGCLCVCVCACVCRLDGHPERAVLMNFFFAGAPHTFSRPAPHRVCRRHGAGP